MACLRSGRNAVIWLGVACNTWVSTSRGSTGRSFAIPEGRCQHKSVADANVMASRAALIALLCSALELVWVVEQPRSSLLFRHDRFLWVAEVLRVAYLILAVVL